MFTRKFNAVVSAIALLTMMACTNNKNDKMDTKNTIETGLFPKGERTPGKWFIGEAYLHPVLPRDSNNNYVIGSVTFEPGARTNWHTHPKGQVLIVTEGEGLYQEKDGPARVIRKGEVISIPADVSHWHGATAAAKMVHIAITNYEGEINAVWQDPVSEAEYKNANQQ